MSSMLLDQVVNSYTKGRNMIMYSMSISKMEYHHSNCRTMSLVASILVLIIEHPKLIVGSENPYGAAQRFLQSNNLPLTYIDEVVKFIEKNTAGVNIGVGGEEYVDPYTGKLTQIFRTIHVHDKVHVIRRIKVSQLSWFSS